MKKPYTSFKKGLLLIAVWCVGLVSQPAQAQAFDPTSLIQAINGVRASLDGIVNTVATYLFQTPPNIGNELVTNNTQSTAIQTVPTNVTTLSDQDLVNGLVPNTQNPNANLAQLSSIQASDTILQSTVLGNLPIPFYSSAAQNSMQNALAQGNENMDFQSLISPISYTTPAIQNLALNYLRFISGYANPVSNFSLSAFPESQLSTKQKLQFQNSPAYQAYQVQRRSLLAQQSAVLSNLYYIYSKRLPITTIHASDTALGVETPSAAQIEDYVATWRTASPTWYTQMATASSANVQRETLYVLAEMQTEMHRMHQDNERIIALLASNQLQTIQNNKVALGIIEKNIKDQVNQIIKKNANAGTTEQTTQSQTQGNPTQQSQVQKLETRQNQAKQAEGQTPTTPQNQGGGQQ